MKREVYLDRIGEQTSLLVLEEGVPVEFAVERAGARRLVGSIFLGRVERVMRGMEAAFVDIGEARCAFLPLEDIPMTARLAGALPETPKAGIVLRPGQDILVQVIKEPVGDKGARVTMMVTLPGRLVVLLPTVEAVGISRHIEGEALRQVLLKRAKAACPEGMGLILRTAGAEAAEAELAREAETLRARWQALVQTAHATKAPALVLEDDELLEKAARDLNAPIALGPWPDAVEAKLEKALRRKVWLPSGAFLVIDHCEAMTVIDVNSGKFTGKKDLRDTLLRLNCEAAEEVARQVRLRDMGGIIVVDFVDMREEADRLTVLEAFRRAMESDRAKAHIHGFTAAGLLEMTRRSVIRPFVNTATEACRHCEGTGRQATPDWQAHRLLRTIRARRASGDTGEIRLTAPETVRAVLCRTGFPEGVTIEPEREEMP